MFLRDEILEQIKSLLVIGDNKDYNCISLYDMTKLLTTFNNQYDEIKRIYKKIFNSVLHSKFKGLVSLITLYITKSESLYANEILKVLYT